jgi:hypothetical protein
MRESHQHRMPQRIENIRVLDGEFGDVRRLGHRNGCSLAQ